MKKENVFGVLAAVSGAVAAAKLLKPLWTGLLVRILTKQTVDTEAATIGIIGGADGPTAIFVTGTAAPGPDWDLILVSAIALLSAFAFLLLRKCKPKE